MPADKPQIDLWSHIQTQQTDAFDLSQKRLDSLVRRAEKLVKGRSLINIGCGNGYLEQAALARRWQVVSIDPDPKSVERLIAKGIDARCSSIESLPLAAEKADVVVCTEVFEHLSPDVLESGLKEIARVLAPGGALIGTVPYREELAANKVFCPHCHMSFHRWGHLQSFDEAGLRSILGRHFVIRTVKPVYFVPWRLVGWKGKLLWLARFIFSFAGVFGSGANLLFVAVKAR